MEELKRVEEMLCSSDDELINLAFIILKSNYTLAKQISEKYYKGESVMGDGYYYIELFDGPLRISNITITSGPIYPKVGEDNNILQFNTTSYVGFYGVRKLKVNERDAQKVEKDNIILKEV